MKSLPYIFFCLILSLSCPGNSDGQKSVVVDWNFEKELPNELKSEKEGLEISRNSNGLTLKNHSDEIHYFRSSASLKFPPADRHTVHRRFELEVSGSGTPGSCVRILGGGKGQSPGYIIMTPEKRPQNRKLAIGTEQRNYKAADDLPDVPELRLYFEIPPKGEFRVRRVLFLIHEERSHTVTSSFSGNIVPADSVCLEVHPLRGRWLRCTVIHTEENGKEISRASFKPEEAIPSVKAGRGYHKFEIRTEFPDGTVLSGKASAAVLGPPLEEKIRMNSPYGLMTNHLPEELAVRASGNQDWRFWYPSILKPDAKGEIPHWKLPPSKLTRHYAMNGQLPASVRDPELSGLRFPKNPEHFSDLLREWARKNARNYDLLSVYNEPDGHFQGTASEFVAFHSLCARAIKQGAPGIKVFGPVLSSLNQANRRRLAEWIELGLFRELDGVTMHPYVDGTSPEGEFIANIDAMLSLLSAHGYGDLPVHLTEFGWTTLPGTWQKPVSELEQARYAARAMILLSTRRIAGAVYFCGRYNPSRSTPPGEVGFSLCERNLEPKPGYASLAFAMKQLAPFPAADGVHCEIAPGAHLVLHRAADRTLAIGWTEEKTYPFLSPLPILRAYDMMGRPLSVSGAAISLTPSPVYLELPRIPKGIQMQNPIRLTDSAPDSPAPGKYHRTAYSNGKLEITPVTVVPELAVTRIMPLPDQLKITVDTARTFSSLKLEFRSEKETVHSRVPNLKAGTHELLLPLRNISSGRRQTGRIAAIADGTIRVERPVDFRILTASRLNSLNDLKKESPVSYADWMAPNEKAPALEDLSASLRLGYTEDFLLAELTVRDNEHIQKHSGQNLWQGDSVQIGLDADAGEPWQPNVARGFNGHRVAEYTAAFHPDSGVLKYRHIALYPGGRPGVPGPEFAVEVSRTGDLTHYRFRIARSAIGASTPWQQGMVLGFSLTVNDSDRGKTRRTMSLGGGIAGPKDPGKYLKLHLK